MEKSLPDNHLNYHLLCLLSIPGVALLIQVRCVPDFKGIHMEPLQRPEFALLNPADTLSQCKYVLSYNLGLVSICVHSAPASVCVPLIYAAACCSLLLLCAGPCSSSAPCCLTDRLLAIAA